MNEKKNSIHTEKLSGGDAEIRRMLNSIDRVEAPGDFDFRLKARIANAGPEGFVRRGAIGFRWALPVLAGLLLIASALIFFIRDRDGGELAVTPPPSVPVGNSETPVSDNARKPEAVAPETRPSTPGPAPAEVAEAVPAGKPSRPVPGNKTVPFNGVREEAFSVPPTINLNINANTAPPRNVQPEVPTMLGIGEIFRAIGINAVYEGAGWKVRSLTENGLAQRSGVLPGDLIEAIDTEKLAADSSFPKSFGGRTVTVIRNGKQMTLNLGSR